MPFARRLCTLLLVPALLLGAAATARAQAMDGQWFKLKVSSNGFAVIASDADAVVKGSFKTTAYMRLLWNGTNYDYSIFTEVSADVWGETTFGALGDLIGANESLGTDDFLSFANSSGGVVEGFVTSRFVIKKDALGNFVSATFKTLGGEAIADSSLDGVNNYRGNIAITGKTVPVSKLPFIPT